MKVEDFVAITKDLCGFPSFFNAPFFRRILASLGSLSGDKAANANAPIPPVENPTDDDAPRITKEVFQAYWAKELAPYDSVERFFRVVSLLLFVSAVCMDLAGYLFLLLYVSFLFRR